MLKVNQYREINSEHIDGLFERMIHMVSVVEDLDPLDVQHWKGNKLIETYSVTQKKVNVSEKYSESIEIEGVKLELLPFTQLTLGQFINLEDYVSKNFNDNMHRIASTIYLSSTESGMFDPIIEDYSKVNVEYRAALIDELPVNLILGACKKYLTFRDTFFDSYEIFTNPFEGVNINELNEEEREIYDQEMKIREKQGDNQWLVILNMLTENDITKFDLVLKQNLFLTFNQISWLKSNK